MAEAKARIEEENNLNDKIASAMRKTFVSQINARKFLGHMRTKENNFFTKEDYEYFDMLMFQDARNVNEEIFDTLVKYMDWFDCLIRAVSDANLHLSHLVQTFSDLRDGVVNSKEQSSFENPATQHEDEALNAKIILEIKETFIRRINARSFLNHIKQHEAGIFYQEDYELFDELMKKNWKNVNEIIYDKLVKKKDWFKCLIRAVSNPNLNQLDLVKTFEDRKEMAEEDIMTSPDQTVYTPSNSPTSEESESDDEVTVQKSQASNTEAVTCKDQESDEESQSHAVKKRKLNESDDAFSKTVKGKPGWCRCGYCDVNEKFNHVCCVDLHKTIEKNNERKRKIWDVDKCVIKWPKVFKTALSQKFLEKEDNWRRYKVEMDPTNNPLVLYQLGCSYFRRFVSGEKPEEKIYAIPSCVDKKLKSRLFDLK
ncbi:uncharacterized protein LOC131938661 [Physella acuta]|uniref:uncharacterized protein LOC131938661 n=1 Tax=Physella acuta TaxID=109671 RepID=UPI0027DD13E3|nr:uncharacterized protein LOC131938661 [Physella acuta]